MLICWLATDEKGKVVIPMGYASSSQQLMDQASPLRAQRTLTSPGSAGMDNAQPLGSTVVLLRCRQVRLMEPGRMLVIGIRMMNVAGTKQTIATLGFPLTRAVVRAVPVPRVVMYFLDRVFNPYFSWRPFETVTRTADGQQMRIRFPDKIQKYIYLFGVWEPVITRFIKARLRPGDLFVDVGANIGYYTLLAAKLVGPGGSVVAIEASPRIVTLLEENIRLNGFTNVEVIQAAVADRRKRVQVFAAGAGNLGQSTIVASTAAALAAPVEAEIDAYALPGLVGIERLRGARFIKVDIEGAEAEMLDGIRDVLATFGDETEWIVELAPPALREQRRSAQEFLELFTAAGYQVYLIQSSYRMESYARPKKAVMERISTVPDGRLTLDLIATKRETEPKVYV
jgi:FkbM family methyltransferase